MRTASTPSYHGNGTAGDGGRPRDEAAVAYVLGLMDADARRAFEAEMLDDAALTALVWRVEERFRPLADAVPPRQPPRRVERPVQRRLFGNTPGEVWPARTHGWSRGRAGLVRSLILLAALAGVAVLPLAFAVLLQPGALWPG